MIWTPVVTTDPLAALPGFRDRAQHVETSRATIRRKTGERIESPDGGLVDEWEVTYADIPCRLSGNRNGQSQSRTVSVGDSEVTLAGRVLHLPSGTTSVADGDVAEIVEGETAGTIWRVIEGDSADQQTALRLPVIAAQRPEEWL